MTQISNDSINFVLFPSQFSGEHQQQQKNRKKSEHSSEIGDCTMRKTISDGI